MKSVYLLFICYFLILNACSAVEKTQATYRRSSWSSSDPLSIPYSTRLQQFEKANLVINPSFENGSVKTGDPAKAFLLEGWETVGQNVEWVTPQSEPRAAAEVNAGQ